MPRQISPGAADRKPEATPSCLHWQFDLGLHQTQYVEQSGVRWRGGTSGKVLVELRTDDSCRSVGVLCSVPKDVDPVLAVIMVPESGDVVTTGLRGDERYEFVSERLRPGVTSFEGKPHQSCVQR